MSSLLGNLPEIVFSELDPAKMESSVITVFEAITGRTLYPGDPERLFCEAMAYLVTMQNVAIDTAAKQNLLAYAEKDHLDHLGASVDTPRLGAEAAVTVMRYSLAEPLEWPVLIPEGSRVCPAEGKIIFRLDRSATIAAGEMFADVPAACLEAGQKGNGLVPGQINKMVDPIAYIKEVANISTSILGSNREEDEPYRRRIQLAPEHFSVAGPEGAYRYHTLSVHPDIADCSVWRPKPGFVDVRPVMKGGELPPENILQSVREKLNDKRIRPLTDTVIVAAPEVRPYAVKGGWYLHRDNEPLAEIIKKKVAAALETFREWQRTLAGRDVNPTRLISLVEQAGAKRVSLELPGFAKLEPWQIARDESVSFEFLGIEDD